MADAKISALTSATTPLAGTEVVPIVQSSSTKKVTVANLTAGRSISTAGASLDGAVTVNDSGAAVDFRVETDANADMIRTWGSVDRVSFGYPSASGAPNAVVTAHGAYAAGDASTSSTPIFKVSEGGALSLWFGGKAYAHMWMQGIQDDGSNNIKPLLLQPLGGGVSVGGTSNLTIDNGNLVIGTSGKGIDFSATGQATGMTSELLSDYEEGTWTPTFTGWDITPTSVIGSRYTKVGRQVTLNLLAQDGAITGGVSVISGLPFTSSSANGATVLIKDVSGSTISSFATVANSATQIASMTTATLTGTFWALSVTYTV